MKSTFGIFTKSLGNVIFGNMKAAVVDGSINPNHPNNPDSPNAPRADRYPGYQNPLLGDPGKGKIGRWQQLNLDALESVIDQIIEQYLRDKTWYGTVRCREALWNMYRRLEWWVAQQVDPSKNDYQRALQMIKDCIHHILEEAQDPALAHNISLPLCPAPYYLDYHADYMNHYDGVDSEAKLFDSRDLPVNNDFPGMFRYVSSTEDKEWTLVHSTGASEMTGTEMILKLAVGQLLYGSSSKVTFNWRFKQRGRIRFKYMASAAAGNGLLFFINNDQVGGEWNQNADWQTVSFNVSPGQTYKFDWLVRRQTEQAWGKNAVYIKDVECSELIRSLDAPTPPDYDTLGARAFADPSYEWLTFSKSSVVRTYFAGVVTNDNRARSLSFDMEAECDGTVSFAYKMGVDTPRLDTETDLFFDDDRTNRTQTGQGLHGSKADKTADSNWTGDGAALVTDGNGATINYELLVGPDCTVSAKGSLEIVCPPRLIDHYEPAILRTLEDPNWSSSGPALWRATGSSTDQEYFLEDPKAGRSDLSTTVSMSDDGWFTFTFDQDLRATEALEVLVDGGSVFQATGRRGETITIPIRRGNHTIIFRVNDSFTEQTVTDFIKKTFDYTGNDGSFSSAQGSKDDIYRNWSLFEGAAQTDVNGSIMYNTVTLNPGAQFELSEKLQFTGSANGAGGVEIFSADFNNEATAGNGMVFSPGWEWGDIAGMEIAGHYGDGVYYVKDKTGTFTATIPSVSVPHGGYLEFQYGGIYGTYDYMMVTAGDVVVYKGAISSNFGDNNIQVPLPAGTYPLKWTYYNEGSKTSPPTTEQPGNPTGEVCYPSGAANFAVDYNSANQDTYSPRTSHMKTGGMDFYTSSSLHAAEVDGATITRDFWAPSFGNINFTEKLQVQAGKGIPVSGTYPVDIEMEGYNQVSMFSDNYYSLDVKSVYAGRATGWATNVFETSGRVNISFLYQTYLVWRSERDPITGEAKTNLNNMDAKYRADFMVYLVPEGAGLSAGYLLLPCRENVGRKQPYFMIDDWSGAKPYTLGRYVTPGRYQLYFVMNDLFVDDDEDWAGYVFYAAFKNLKVTTVRSSLGTGYDNTRVRAELINRNTGAVEQTKIYDTQGAASADYNINFFGLSPSTAYQVRYTLLQGAGTEGGLYNRGGSFSVTGGRWIENYGAYCKDQNGNYYPESQSTQRPPSEGTTDTAPSVPGEWAWLDAINVYAAPTICSDTAVELLISDGSNIVSDQVYHNTNSEQMMVASVVNNTKFVKTYYITQTFRSTCGDGAVAYGGQATITEHTAPPYAYARVTDFKLTNNKAIWMGGCDGSSINVSLIRTDNGASVYNQTFSGSGIHSFDVSNLLSQPYSKYRLTIKTDQKGTVSAVTGKPYLTTFKLVDLKMIESWKNIPDPFNGKLEFFMDGISQAAYTTVGGFYTVSFPLPKGKHNLKWVFTELGSGNTYDQCEIDFLKITNWICDKVKVTPYCEPGGGDKCVEELIKCLLQIWRDRPKACVIGKTIWLFT